MLWIKICGTTNLGDARAAIAAGANALGFIFAPSPRQIAPDAAAVIVRGLPAEIEKVGVFVNEAPERIAAIAQEAGLTAAQLHGDETAGAARALQVCVNGRRLRLFKTLHMSNGHAPAFAETRALGQFYDALLLDAGTPAQRGGTGRAFDWEDAERMVSLLRRPSKAATAADL